MAQEGEGPAPGAGASGQATGEPPRAGNVTSEHPGRDRPGSAPPHRRRDGAAGPADAAPAVGALWRAWAYVVVGLRYLVVLGWIVAAAAATLFLPGISSSGALGNLLPHDSPALRAEYDATRLFGLPLVSQAVVVQRNPHGFSRQAQLHAARAAAALDQRHVQPVPGLAAAVPIANIAGQFPGSRERDTTILTYLYFRPGTSTSAQAAGAQAYARRYLSRAPDHLAGVTGPAPAEDAQGTIILRYLPWVEAATVLAIALIVGIYFRSIGAPLATLLCAGVAYLVAIRVDGWAAQRFSLTVPPDLEPVLVVLLLGVTTDYAVFFLAGMRSRLAAGATRLPAARRTTAEFTPIILTAGLIVALGIGSLAVAPVATLRAFGPALAVTVLTGMLVAVTLAPALIGIFGGLLFHSGPAALRGAWRSRRGDRLWGRRPPGQDSAPRRWQQEAAGVRPWRQVMARVVTSRPVALVVALACVAGLLLAAAGVRQLRLGFPLVRALPASSEPVRAQDAAWQGFVPGVLSPTEVLVLGSGVGKQQAALDRLQHALARRPGVAAVIGPADRPPVPLPVHVTVSRSGNAARYALIERTDPLGPAAIAQVRTLRRDLPGLAAAAGLAGARVEVGGETAFAGEAIETTETGLWRIALVIAVVIFVLLAVFLRSLLAPLYLLVASVLALLAALGLTVWIFQGILRYSGLVYYVPFAVAVLLISLGSDYNVFVVGRIWEEARRRPLREAVAVAVPRASRAITTAGLALAAGFGVLALVPLRQFWEIAVAMIIGIILDTFVVRSLLVPALVVLFGRAGRWPGGRARARGQEQPAVPLP
jgi:putative drug exporter of the RND superfamily